MSLPQEFRDMPKLNIILTVIFFLPLYVVVPIAPAILVDAETHWLIVDATPEARAHELLNALTELLVARGKVPAEQIHRIEGTGATSAEIHAMLQEIGNKPQEQETLIFFYHGMVTKPRGMNVMHLLVQGDEPGIEDLTLNQWFKAAGRNRTVVIIDGYTNDTNLSAYYANRETLGTAALNVIQSAEMANATSEKALLQQLHNALSADTTDVNDDRHLSIIETYELLRENPNFEAGILAPTGNVEEALLKLSPALKITTFPEGALILLNDVEIGSTPKLITENLQQGTSTVTVKKAGYVIPPPKTAELNLILGESVHLGWALEPIAVYGTVQGISGESVEGATVRIEGTDYQQVIDEETTYRFDKWKTENPLTLGETYTLSVKHGELHYGSAAFTFDGYTAIEQPLSLAKKTWFEMAQIEFDRNNHQEAVTAFQNGIERTTDFPPMSPELTILLLSSFADAINKLDVQDVTYIVVTAKLAEQHNQPALAKRYWEQVKVKAQKGSPAAKLANQRLWKLNRGRYLLNIALAVLVGVLLVSSAWTFYRYRKSKQTAS